ncbi:GlxA family transcriptional regulator [Glutamicibacter sp. M10]|uniref:GlxA family transcriptional regulator n=1 Tax=Glutamicibacter sp. M10 TaxID=3023076 RepID=UPI0021C9427C|nr:helix-turn-helix domain-containing protein [Glutamicibacter sp. M10]UXN31722.1 helix-turn-helix domain-containing protein [Glutamicibacter sp. M10]
MTNVGILVGPGRRAFDLAVVREVYDDRSDRGLPRPTVRILAARAITDLDPLHSIRRTHGLDTVEELDMLVVPGSEDPLAELDAREVSTVARAASAGVLVASLCTGAFTLAAAGLLDGRQATTHWRYADELVRRYPRIHVKARDLYCGEDKVWTSAGVTAGVDLLLQLVRLDWGTSAAETVAKAMVTPVFRPGTQAQYADTNTPTSSAPSVENLHFEVRADLQRPWSVKDLSAICAMSPRTFHRWFSATVGTTPVRWLNDLRVQEAQRLLEQTGLSVGAIAREVGFASDDLLRKHFTARLGITPTSHASTFRQPRP